MKAPLVLGMTVPAVLLVVLIYGGMAYSPKKRQEYPAQFGLNERIAVAREAAEVRYRGAGPTTGEPRLEIMNTVHDFGVMSLHEIGQTKFYIRSIGTGRVDLMDGGKSCQCVGFRVSDRQLEPGEMAEVVMEWETSEPAESYSQVVVLRTNCEATPELRLEVRGRVKELFAGQPATFPIGRLLPTDTVSEKHIWIYSHEWSEIENLNVRASDPRFETSVDEVMEGAPHQSAKWMRRVTLRTPEGLESGGISCQVTISGKSPSGDALELTIPVEGYVTKRVTITGNAIDGYGMIEFGTLNPFEGATRVFTVRVNDPETQLSIKQVQTELEFLQVELEPIENAAGLYRLRLSIPADRPDGGRAGAAAAPLVISFDHPRVEPLELRVSYVALSNLGR